LVAVERALGEADPLRRLAAVLGPGREAAKSVAGRLRLSNAESERLVALAAPESPVSVTADSKTQRRELYRLGAARYRDLALIVWAEAPEKDASREQAFRSMLAAAQSWRPVTLPVKGRDVLALGVENGPKVGSVLREIEAWWIEGDFQAGRDECMKKLKSLVMN
jgi:poly(A) polymerase